MKIWLDDYYTETKDAPAFKRPRKRRAKRPSGDPASGNTATCKPLANEDRRLLKT